MEKNWYRQTPETFKASLKKDALEIPFQNDVSCLKNGLKIGNKSIPNRIVIQPMEGCDCSGQGVPTELTFRRYLRFAQSGAGVIWFEANAVLPEGKANPRQMMITDANIGNFKRLVNDIRENSLKRYGYTPLLVLQLTHSGRYSKPEGTPTPLIAYKSKTLRQQEKNAVVVSDDYLASLPTAFAHATRLARQAGFDAVDIKACHRYLLSELLSAYVRAGRYGGSYENRTRLLKECVQACTPELDDMLVASRINIYDGFAWPDGWGVKPDGSAEPDMTEPIRLIAELFGAGMHLTDLTLGNPYFNPHINRPYALGAYQPPEDPLRGVERACRLIGQIKRAVPQVNVIASALSYLRQYAGNVGAAMVAEGLADMVGYGRMSFAYPEFASALLHGGKLDQNKVCVTCSKCTELMRAGCVTGCVVRDSLYTRLYQEMQANA